MISFKFTAELWFLDNLVDASCQMFPRCKPESKPIPPPEAKLSKIKHRMTVIVWDKFVDDGSGNVVVHEKAGTEVVQEVTFTNPLQSSVIKIAAFVRKGSVQVGSIMIPVKKLREIVAQGGTILLHHAWEQYCTVCMKFPKEQSPPAWDFDGVPSKLEDMPMYHELIERVSKNVELNVKSMKEVNPYFLPEMTSAKDFVDMITVFPAYMYEVGPVEVPMPTLKKTFQNRGASVSLHALVYFFHAACLFEGITEGENVKELGVLLHFRLYNTMVTLMTASAKFDKYTSDDAISGYHKVWTWDNEENFALEFKQSENFRCPLTKAKVAGCDCEDWAMCIFFVSLSLIKHQKDIKKFAEEDVENYTAFRGLKFNSDKIKMKALFKRLDVLATHAKEGGVDKNGEAVPRMEVRMATVSAGAPSCVAGAGGGNLNKPGGHECCVSVLNAGKNEQVKCRRAVVLEGTNWCHNTVDMPVATCKMISSCMVLKIRHIANVPEDINGLSKMTIDDKLEICHTLETLRPRMVEYLGKMGSGKSDSFYRSMFVVGEDIVTTVDREGDKCISWGADPADVIDTLSGRTYNVAFNKFSADCLLPNEKSDLMGYLEGLSDEVQVPPITKEEWDTRIKSWHELQELSTTPNLFTEAREFYENNERCSVPPVAPLFTSTTSTGKLYGHYTKSVKKMGDKRTEEQITPEEHGEGFLFMDVMVSVCDFDQSFQAKALAVMLMA